MKKAKKISPGVSTIAKEAAQRIRPLIDTGPARPQEPIKVEVAHQCYTVPPWMESAIGLALLAGGFCMGMTMTLMLMR